MQVGEFKKFLKEKKIPDDYFMEFSTISSNGNELIRNDNFIYGLIVFPEHKEVAMFPQKDFESIIESEKKKHSDHNKKEHKHKKK